MINKNTDEKNIYLFNDFKPGSQWPEGENELFIATKTCHKQKF